MTEADVRHQPPSTPVDPHTALVWIDSREAVIVRRQDGRSRIERIESEVPAHHRATGHVRHDPAVRYGGGGRSQTAGEPHRLEHLARFLDLVAGRIGDEDLLLIGPGTVREHLERRIRADDASRHITRRIDAEPGVHSTERRLVARLRRHLGDEPRRCSVGSYRWSEPVRMMVSGKRIVVPRRVVAKPRKTPQPPS